MLQAERGHALPEPHQELQDAIDDCEGLAIEHHGTAMAIEQGSALGQGADAPTVQAAEER